jgi:4-hydroxyacetophenone monooxygenase
MPDIGGTWLIDNYPEARVDTLSYLFQYRFEKNYKWSEYFASSQETQKYLEHVCQKHGVKKDFQFNKEVVGAVWNESSSTWKLRITNKQTGAEEFVEANSIISASGLFSTPNLPDIKGITDYKGHMFHTTKWDHSIDYTGMRVAVIGTGSTGTQLVPGMVPKVKSLAVYQRSPNWIASYEGYGTDVEDHHSKSQFSSNIQGSRTFKRSKLVLLCCILPKFGFGTFAAPRSGI